MQSKNPFNWRLFALLSILGALGIILLIPYELSMIERTGLPSEASHLKPSIIVAINSFSQLFILLVLVFLGERMLKRTGLDVPYLNAFVHQKPIPSISLKWIYLSIGISLIGTIIIYLLDWFVFMPAINLPAEFNASMDWWQGLLAMFYGGFTEELMVRFFGVTLVVWLLAVIFQKKRGEIPKFFYILAIVIAAVVFGLGHLPATMQMFGDLTPLLVIRALVLNGLLGLWFGYLFYRKGLEYAILAHMSADLFLHVIFPLFL